VSDALKVSYGIFNKQLENGFVDGFENGLIISRTAKRVTLRILGKLPKTNKT
jgi:hypothetical protein